MLQWASYSFTNCHGTRTHNRLVRKLVVGSSPVAVTETWDIAPVSGKAFLDNQTTTECRFTLNASVTLIKTRNQVIICLEVSFIQGTFHVETSHFFSYVLIIVKKVYKKSLIRNLLFSLLKHTWSWRVNLLYYEYWTDKQKYLPLDNFLFLRNFFSERAWFT